MMTRSERLLFLIRRLRDHKGVSLDDMCKRCDVSPRTLYRDFRTLSRLSYPIRFDHGYYVSKGPLPAPVGISLEEIQLVRLALRLAPLNKYPWLRREIVAIDTKLEVSVCDQTNSERKPQIGFDGEFRILAEIALPRLVELFLRAIRQKRRVVIIRRGEPAGPPVVPIALSLRAGGLYFTFAQSREESRSEVDVTAISNLRIVTRSRTR
jgi:predicted DNA-binding transcriptional regulator YafY